MAREIPKHLLWLDLETTGTSEYVHKIVEVGVAITDATPDLTLVQSAQFVIYNDLDVLEHMESVVVDMHAKSGLLADIVKGNGDKITDVDAELHEWVKPYLNEGGIIHLAGSGVGHFDMRFLKRHMPRLFAQLEFAPYDLGSLRRFLRLVGIEAEERSLSHRALGDVFDHISEARELLAAAREKEGFVLSALIGSVK